MSTLVLIPARLGSTRLPRKALADIVGKPMVVRVAERAALADVGRVVVATDADEILHVVRNAGFEAVMTSVEHQSGSDRIHEALLAVDPNGDVETVINVQGDLPTIDPETIRLALKPFEEPSCDIATLAAEIRHDDERINPNVVKLVGSPIGPNRLHALYFTRATAPWGEGPHYHHIGLYAYRRASLERFVRLAPSVLERREKLEQLRALENGMRIDAEIVDTVPLGVDGPDDLARAREILGA
ncbi:3-deoxy-manno-octulosonate cytidylyltransferase [Jiella sp. MQZ9-1]|uniref:3-deoxy-manno-octulosonate cytidylyltransferase n=1 Tax=Jiella flava TaxID=2816857 RepID=A0A939FYH5_9HYPH|nr:3-deoxy-manno-octulosonate cytidylyltransferase [Jiella flava]MBO0663204.1 3-deoxy-manno-octulosonate cytidylyltransferase [Jiella flava]MCD2471779.1 3-deoxy-manno-octulosonate cytidylyltransferase [Jiella flava]